MNFLAIESSCDETSVAIFTDDLQILANVVASQIDLHARFGGVVPVADRAADGLLRVPALLRAGPARGLGQVGIRHMSVAIVGGGLAGFTAHATLVYGGLEPGDMAVFDASADPDPAAVWRRRAAAIRQVRIDHG